MASGGQLSPESDEESFYDSESDSILSDSDDYSDSSTDEDDCQDYGKEPCKYYNSGGCRDGSRCAYLHVCKYALNGNCRYGSRCKLNHSVGGTASSGASGGASGQSTANSSHLTNGQHYQWQLDDGHGWKDIDNDHILEAQYSLPHTKSIKIYNTPYGAVIVDFNRMKVCEKNLRVRRLDDGNTTWIWYCTLRRKWKKYGAKDSTGNPGPVNSSDIEKKFQRDPRGSFTFNISGDTFEIKFREMVQVGNKTKRRVTRRPQYRQPQITAGVAQAALQNLTLHSKPQWQFEADRSGRWYNFTRTSSTDCSVTSDDIERKYQQNPSGSISFKVKDSPYKLDFGAMIQTNVNTSRTRRIRRVMK